MAKQLKQYTRVSDINVGDAGVARGYSGAPTLRALRSGPVRLGQLARLAFPQRALVIVGSIASSRSGIAAKQSVPIRMLTPVSSLERNWLLYSLNWSLRKHVAYHEDHT
jgi:hypothetical protein